MKKTESYEQHITRLLKWIQDYNGFWQMICTPSNDEVSMNMTKMKMLVEKLSEESLYEIIFVLFTVHRNESYMKSFVSYAFLDMVKRHWDEDREYIINLLTDYLE